MTPYHHEFGTLGSTDPLCAPAPNARFGQFLPRVYKIRIRFEPQDCKRAWSHRAPNASRPGRRGHRIRLLICCAPSGQTSVLSKTDFDRCWVCQSQLRLVAVISTYPFTISALRTSFEVSEVQLSGDPFRCKGRRSCPSFFEAKFRLKWSISRPREAGAFPCGVD